MSLRERLKLTQEPLFLMDGTAYIFRSFFVGKNIQRSDGFPTNVLLGVTRLLLKILREEKPRYFLFVRDGHGPTFRNTIYSEYKANREATPEDLVRQIDPVCRMVHALGLADEETHGFEADDCIATLAASYAQQMPVVIISGDKDLKQCLGPDVYMWNIGGKEDILLTEEDFTKETGVRPASWPDMQALIGDTADNIPGVPGIGIKTAQQIFTYCSTLEELKERIIQIPPRLQKKLEGHLDRMFTWRDLTRLSLEYEPRRTLESMEVQPLRADECRVLADEFELASLRRELEFVRVTQQDREPRKPDALRSDGQSGHSPEVRDGSEASSPASPDAQSLLARPVSVVCRKQDASSRADLPECAGRICAVIGDPFQAWMLRLAVADETADDAGQKECTEYVWKGTQTDLCAYLADAGRIIVADLKAFLQAGPCYRAFFGGLACDRIVDLGLAYYLLYPEETDFSWKHIVSYWGTPFQDGRGEAGIAICLARNVLERLNQASLLSLFRNLELPLVAVLSDMEQEGIAIDQQAFNGFLRDVQKELDQLTTRIFSLSGSQFNIRSSQQLGHILYTVLKLKGGGRTKGGQASTNQQALEKLAGEHPVVDAVLQYRKLEKIRSTYLDPLPKLADQNGRIHTHFNQKGTATGRLSSYDPNLQNIPARGDLGARMRRCFVAGSGYSLLSSDYSQIELRVLAHMSADPALLQAFQNGLDIHAHTAHLIYAVPLEEVSREQRRSAKTINFGLIYGMGAQKLAQELSVPLAHAKDFIARYFEKLTVLKAFYDRIVQEAKAAGYVTTLGGRRRSLPDLLSMNAHLSSQAGRQAVNTVIQGSAADIIKMAMLSVAHDGQLQEMGARLLLQIHDELLLEVPSSVAEDAGKRVASLMENVMSLSVPLVADWGCGASWDAAH